MEGVAIGVWVLIGLVGIGLMGLSLAAWTVWRLWRRKPRVSAVAWTLALVITVSVTYGAFGTFVGLVQAFGAVGGESIDPSQKARILAEGISEAMNCTAFGMLFWIPCLIVAFVLVRPEKPRPS